MNALESFQKYYQLQDEQALNMGPMVYRIEFIARHFGMIDGADAFYFSSLKKDNGTITVRYSDRKDDNFTFHFTFPVEWLSYEEAELEPIMKAYVEAQEAEYRKRKDEEQRKIAAEAEAREQALFLRLKAKWEPNG